VCCRTDFARRVAHDGRAGRRTGMPQDGAAGNPNVEEMGMNEDQPKGRIKEVEGKLREVTGRIVGHGTLEAKGRLERAVGRALAGRSDIKEDIKEDIKKA